MRGRFLVLEGGDGAGKSSQLALLTQFYEQKDGRVKSLHFPRLSSKPYGEMIGDFLRGEFGSSDSVHPKLAALLYALDRQQASETLRTFLDAGGTLLADRYFFSNIAYQCAKIADPEERRRLAEWIEKLEYGTYRIPRPDITLYLDVPLDFALGNLTGSRQGAERGYLQGGRDIHEENHSLQKRVRAEFVRLAEERPEEVGVVDCRADSGEMADKNTIHTRILDALRRYEILQ